MEHRIIDPPRSQFERLPTQLTSGSISSLKDKAVLYTALTRVRKHELGCRLTVISCYKHLEPFGRTWPDFDQQ